MTIVTALLFPVRSQPRQWVPAELVPIADAGRRAVVVPRALSLSSGQSLAVYFPGPRSRPAGRFFFRPQPHQ